VDLDDRGRDEWQGRSIEWRCAFFDAMVGLPELIVSWRQLGPLCLQKCAAGQAGYRLGNGGMVDQLGACSL